MFDQVESNKEKHVCDRLAEIRNRLNLSMAKMAKSLGYTGASSYQYYEDKTAYKKNYFDADFLQRMQKGLVPLGISEEEIRSLASMQTHFTEIAIKETTQPEPIVALTDIAKRVLFLLIRRCNVRRDEISTLLSTLKDDYEAFSPPQSSSAEVVGEVLNFVNGLSLEGEPLKVEKLLQPVRD